MCDIIKILECYCTKLWWVPLTYDNTKHSTLLPNVRERAVKDNFSRYKGGLPAYRSNT